MPEGVKTEISDSMALDVDDMVFGIDPTLRLNFNAFIGHAGIAVGHQAETDGLQALIFGVVVVTNWVKLRLQFR